MSSQVLKLFFFKGYSTDFTHQCRFDIYYSCNDFLLYLQVQDPWRWWGMGPGVEESWEHRYHQHQEVQWHPGSLVVVCGCCRNMFVTMSYSQQWQEEEAGWGKRHSKQWGSAARETKKEGNATRQIQEEQGQAWQIWKEGVTVNSAALTGQCVWAQSSINMICIAENFGYLGRTCRYWRAPKGLDIWWDYFLILDSFFFFFNSAPQIHRHFYIMS